MLSSADIEDLRSSGLSDDQIVAGFQKVAPQFSGDIESLKKDNVPSSFILQHIDKFQAPAAPGKTIGQRASDIAGAITTGVGNEFHQLAGTTRDLGGTNAAAALDATGGLADKFTPDGYKPSEFHLNDPSTYTNLPEKLAGGAPGALATIGAGAAAAGLAGLATVSAPVIAGAGLLGAGTYGAYKYLHGIAQDRAQNNGRTEVTPDDLKAAIPGAVAGGAIDAATMKLGGFLGKDAATAISSSVPKTMATQYLGSAGSDVVNQAAGSLGTDKGLNLDPTHAMDAGVVGAIGAGVAKRAGETIDDVKALPLRKFDAEFFDKHAQDVADAYGKNTSEKVQNAAENAKLDYKEAIKPPKLAEGEEKPPESQTKVPQSVQEAHGAISRGTVLSKDDISSLRDDLSDHHNGSAIVDALGRMNEANKLAGTGNNVTRALESTGLVHSADPKSFAQATANSLFHFGSIGGAAWALAHGNPLYAGLAIGAPIAAKLAARGADRALGLNDPVGQWLQRAQAMRKLNAPPASQVTAPALPPSPVPNVPAEVLRTANPEPTVDMAGAEQALAFARAQATRQRPPVAQATPVAPEAPVAAVPPPAGLAEAAPAPELPPALRNLPPDVLAAIMSGNARLPGTKGKPGATFQPKVIAPTEAAPKAKAMGTTPALTSINLGDEVIRQMPIDAITHSEAHVKRGGTNRVETRAHAYNEPVPGLSASEASHWGALTKKPSGPDAMDGGAIREHFNRNSFDGIKAAEDHMHAKLAQHGFSHKATGKIVGHLKSKGYFRTWHRKKRK